MLPAGLTLAPPGFRWDYSLYDNAWFAFALIELGEGSCDRTFQRYIAQEHMQGYSGLTIFWLFYEQLWLDAQDLGFVTLGDDFMVAMSAALQRLLA